MNKAKQYLPDPPVMLGLLLVLGTLPLWIGRVGLYQYLAIEIIIWCIYALGYNLALGYTGLPSFGHGAFFGIGAYAMAIYQLNFAGTNLWVGLGSAVLAAAVAGGLVGLFVRHRRGIYFALMTIAFGQIFWFLAIKLRWLTKGEDGLLNLSRLPARFGFFELDLSDPVRLYYFTLVLFFLIMIFLWAVISSPFGNIIQAVKQNEARSRFIGYDVRVFKWMSFVLSTAVAGFAGGLFALAQQSAFPDVMALHWSGIIVMMVIIGGGLVSYWGPIWGVIFYFLMRDVLGAFTETWVLWFGLSFMLVMLFQPEGIAGIWQKYRPQRLKIDRMKPARPLPEATAVSGNGE
jgi:branched-chain amino acid transport system permease protein